MIGGDSLGKEDLLVALAQRVGTLVEVLPARLEVIRQVGERAHYGRASADALHFQQVCGPAIASKHFTTVPMGGRIRLLPKAKVWDSVHGQAALLLMMPSLCAGDTCLHHRSARRVPDHRVPPHWVGCRWW